MGDIFGCTRTHICRLLLSTACCVLQGAAWLWGFALSLLSRLCQGEDPEWDPVLFLVKTMYDETPSRVRAVSTAVQTWMAPNAKKYPSEYLSEVDLREYEKLVSTAETGTHAKVLQTRYMVGMLLRHRETGAFGWFRGDVLPELNRISSPFRLRVRHTVTDRYTANRKAEKGLGEADFTPGWVRNHGPCDIHKAASAVKCVLKALEWDVSGVLATGLALSEIGAARKLRQCLAQCFEESLNIDPLPCPNADEAAWHRQCVYDTFLSIDKAATPQARKQNRLRRFVLETFLNSDLVGPAPLTHHCSAYGCCASEQHTRQYFNEQLG
ncbi:unnamed protein product [Symbiodinium necroappetens]|uniref:Uncharacterized protein n=1 Tax=Symbiodinium necroappetens TaxID=1628268 RepID=A0A813AK10_9DINO|nr:unnamed protein product [Symbiodinium necroappetens]